MDKKDEFMFKIKEALKERDIELKTDFDEVTLLFPNGDRFKFKAVGSEGTRLVMEASVMLTGMVYID